jgi:acetyl-CoA carboxylase carboxyltransferase component
VGADAQLQERLDRLESDGPWNTADSMGFDEVIDPRELRNALLSGLELASQRGTRRLAPTANRGIRP